MSFEEGLCFGMPYKLIQAIVTSRKGVKAISTSDVTMVSPRPHHKRHPQKLTSDMATSVAQDALIKRA